MTSEEPQHDFRSSSNEEKQKSIDTMKSLFAVYGEAEEEEEDLASKHPPQSQSSSELGPSSQTPQPTESQTQPHSSSEVQSLETQQIQQTQQLQSQSSSELQRQSQAQPYLDTLLNQFRESHVWTSMQQTIHKLLSSSQLTGTFPFLFTLNTHTHSKYRAHINSL
jgi:hypothetical protein